jgi:catechol 2,3-dioxygenase-like lactoylglutathione lyase family enzyme
MYFEIRADDLQRAGAFYEGVFGWTFTEQQAAVPYYRIMTEGIVGGLLARAATKPPDMAGTNAFTVSMEVASFDAVAPQLSNGADGRRCQSLQFPASVGGAISWIPRTTSSGFFQPDPSAA